MQLLVQLGIQAPPVQQAQRQGERSHLITLNMRTCGEPDIVWCNVKTIEKGRTDLVAQENIGFSSSSCGVVTHLSASGGRQRPLSLR